jgi:hypothetical protein
MSALLLLLLLPLQLPAWAAAPPFDLALLEDTAPWEERARLLRQGPPGCVELEGRAELRLVLYEAGGWASAGAARELRVSGPFGGTLDQGVWTRLSADLRSVGEDELRAPRVRPMVGRVPPGPDGAGGQISISMGSGGTDVDLAAPGMEAADLLDGLVDAIDPAVTTAFAQWDPARRAVVLREQVPLQGPNRGEQMEVRSFFPEGGAPTALDVVFPARVRLREGLVAATARNAQLHLRGQESALGLLPGSESLSVVVGALGFTLGFEQRLHYSRARACGAPPPAEAPAAGAPPAVPDPRPAP